MPDIDRIITTAQPRYQILYLGDGILFGEVRARKFRYEGDAKFEYFIIKASDEFLKWYKDKIKPQDYVRGYIQWVENSDFIVDLSRNPEHSILFALRTFDRQDSPMTQLNRTFIDRINQQNELLRERDKWIKTLQVEIQKYNEGDPALRAKAMVREENRALITEILAAFNIKKSV